MQEELERKSISVTVQATKLTGRVMRAAIAATLRKIEKERNSPPKWTVYFKANQADAIEAAFKKYTQKTVKRENRPSLLSQLSKFKEMARKMARDPVKNKEHGGPER